MIYVELCGVGEGSRSALRQAIRDLQATDPVRPVTVAVPSNYSGLSLRRSLARPHEGHPGGLLNVRFLVLPRIAELLGAPILAAQGQRPLTDTIQGELIRRALEEGPGAFAEVAGHPATERRLAESFRELREITPEKRSTLSMTGGITHDVMRLFDRVMALVDGQFYDDAALAEAAAEAARTGHAALRDLGTLVVYTPGPLRQGERRFVEALADRQDVRIILGITGDALADTPVLEQWEPWVTEPRPGLALATIPVATGIVSAPDAEEEARQAVRMIVAEMEAGTPPHRMALLSRHASPYTTLASGVLRDAGIPWNGSNPVLLSHTVTGRALLGVVSLPGRQFRRGDVSAWLSAAPILSREHGEVVPAYRWDALARRAGVVLGESDWQLRLETYEAQLRRDLAAVGSDDGPPEWTAGRLTRDIEEIEALRTFVDELIALLAHPRAATWEMHAEWAQRLITRYVGSEASLAARLPDAAAAEHEVEAYRSISDALDSLGSLGLIRPEVDVATFQHVLQRELERPTRRISRFGDGVFIGRLADAVGTDFDHVFVLGMNEGAIPSEGSDDPLVPDQAWDAVGQQRGTAVRGRRARARAEERRVYLSALGVAARRTLLAPRADLRGAQGRLRSRWLIESASQLAGRRLNNESLDRADEPWHTLVPSFEGALRAATPAVSLAERDIRSLHAWKREGRPLDAHPLTLEVPTLSTGWEAQQGRRSAAFTRWDGQVGRLPAALLAETAEREHSPTSLERWAVCPRQYFFGTVLRVAEREEPDLLLSISALDRGTLIHDVLDRFIRERHVETPDARWTDDDRARLLALAHEACDEAEASGLTGAPLLWRLDRARIIRDLVAFLATDEEYRRELQVVPTATELAIGGARPVVVELGDGRELRLRGRVDRVDRSPDGDRTVVIDYKTGSPAAYRKLDDDPVQAGRLLQLPVYALGAQVAYETSSVDSRYWFTRHDLDEGQRFAGYVANESVIERFRAVLRSIVDGIAGGVFIGAPGAVREDGYEHCRDCPYDAVCERDRGRQFDRKSGASAVHPFIGLSLASTDLAEEAST